MDRKLIYDLGLHTGQDTEYYLKKGFKVVAIDANPVMVKQAQKRFHSEVSSGQLRLLNVGIAESAGRVPFYVHKTLSQWSSLDFEIGTTRGEFEVVEVETTPLADVLAEFGIPYYLKIDIEGMDFVALQSLHQFGDRPKYVSAENGPPKMLMEMVDLGYVGFKFVNQKTIPQTSPPEPALEGLYVPWVFPIGASGPFGQETPGEWLNAEAVLERINSYWGNPKRDANVDGWFDLHGMREG